MRLIFVGETCVQRIGGQAVNSIPGSTEIAEPPEMRDLPVYRIRLSGGNVTAIPLTQAEIDAENARVEQGDVLRKIVHAFFNHENRLRVLEGKAPITREQFVTAVKAL